MFAKMREILDELNRLQKLMVGYEHDGEVERLRSGVGEDGRNFREEAEQKQKAEKPRKIKDARDSQFDS